MEPLMNHADDDDDRKKYIEDYMKEGDAPAVHRLVNFPKIPVVFSFFCQFTNTSHCLLVRLISKSVIKSNSFVHRFNVCFVLFGFDFFFFLKIILMFNASLS